jgi:hypothetical protein
MKRLLILPLLLIFLSCASLKFDTESQGARIGVKGATIVLIDKGYVTKERLSEVVEAGIKLLGEDSEADIEAFIRKQIKWDKLSAPAKLAVDEFLLTMKDNIEHLTKNDSVEAYQKQAMVVLGWIEDTLKLY